MVLYIVLYTILLLYLNSYYITLYYTVDNKSVIHLQYLLIQWCKSQHFVGLVVLQLLQFSPISYFKTKCVMWSISELVDLIWGIFWKIFSEPKCSCCWCLWSAHVDIHKHAGTNPQSGAQKLIWSQSWDQVCEEMGTCNCLCSRWFHVSVGNCMLLCLCVRLREWRASCDVHR